MIEKKIVATNLLKISLNFTVTIPKGYCDFIYERLNSCGISESDFVGSCERLMNFTKELNKMPSFYYFCSKDILIKLWEI